MSQLAFVLTLGVTVGCSVSYNSRSPLVISHTSLTAPGYIDTNLRTIALPFMARHPGACFRQDNVRPHITRIFQDCLRSVNILCWLAKSTYLSPIKTSMGHGLAPDLVALK
ncbi:transcription initiation factor TFIID subunit 5 [Trichonephila clavipes]|nr:transcription initiation factor TFIID subunit 5 [Trichonephila clavipes]